jgi:tetratricopeptide (TPR) repeat protein
VSTLLRWFSPSYRYALQAEAEGRYVEAARAYALCGQRLKVAEMHLLEAERRGAPASALRELHVAAHFAQGGGEKRKALRLRLGQLYLRVLKKSVLTPADRELCAEAAELLLDGGDAAAAGEAYELGGDLERAAAAYEQAGDIERVESLHDAAESNRLASSQERDALFAYHTFMELGQRSEALSALQKYTLTVTPGSGALEAQQLLADLRQRLLPSGQVRLRGPSFEALYVGRFPLLLGRGAGKGGATTESLLSFPDPGLSRDHAQLECRELDGTTFFLRDLTSKNGTTLNGLPITAGQELPLRGEGDFALGPHVALRFSCLAQRLELHVERGLLRGTRVIASLRPIPLDGGLELHFGDGGGKEGQPCLDRAGAPELVLNGKRVPRTVQLLRGDVIEAAGHRYEVA